MCIYVYIAFVGKTMSLHPGKLIWNPKMEVWKMIFLFKLVFLDFMLISGVYILVLLYIACVIPHFDGCGNFILHRLTFKHRHFSVASEGRETASVILFA